MGPTVTTDPLAKTFGLMPRYVRERQAAEALGQACRAAPPPTPAVPDAFASRPCDPLTADLRRRIAIAKPPRPVKLLIAAPTLAGVLLMLRALLNT